MQLSKRSNLILFMFGLICAAFLLSACKKPSNKKFVDQETYDLMKQTQAELSACAERCRDAARGGHDDSYLLRALANSQETLVMRHEAILKVLRRKFKLEAYNATVGPSVVRVLECPEDYVAILSRPDNSSTPREVLIALEVTEKVLKQDGWLEKTAESTMRPIEDLHLCTVCGFLAEGEIEKCPVCDSSAERIVKLDSRGEIPVQEAESYVVRKE